MLESSGNYHETMSLFREVFSNIQLVRTQAYPTLFCKAKIQLCFVPHIYGSETLESEEGG